jgi:hypothetical protein
LQTIIEIKGPTPVVKYHALRSILLLYTGARKFNLTTGRSLHYYYSAEGIKSLSVVLENTLSVSSAAEHDDNTWKLLTTIMQMYFLVASYSGTNTRNV